MKVGAAVRVRATVHGRVQLVGFRAWVLDVARDVGGTVCNRPDGTVDVVAEGPADAVDRLVVLLRDGPPGARVDHVGVERLPATGSLGPMRIV